MPGSHASASSVRDVIASCTSFLLAIRCHYIEVFLSSFSSSLFTSFFLSLIDRRAQYFVAGSSVASVSDDTQSLEDDDGDVEAGLAEDVDETENEDDYHERVRRPSSNGNEDFVNQLEWDGDGPVPHRHGGYTEPSTPFLPSRSSYAPTTPRPQERTPLLHPKVSRHSFPLLNIS